MSQFILLAASGGGFANMDYVRSIYPVEESGVWYLEANIADTGNKINGSWATWADAVEAARQLTQGIDPSVYNS